MLANLYKRLTITTNALPLIRMACELLPNMLRIYVFTNFRNMFLKFAKPRERPRMYTNTSECKAISMRPLRFVTKLLRYYVNDTIRNIIYMYSPRCKSSIRNMKIEENLTLFSRATIHNDKIDTLKILSKCFKILANQFYEWQYTCINAK